MAIEKRQRVSTAASFLFYQTILTARKAPAPTPEYLQGAQDYYNRTVGAKTVAPNRDVDERVWKKQA